MDKRNRLLVLAVVLSGFVAGAGADAVRAEEGRLTLALGTEYTTGEYGGEKSIEDLYIPVTAYYDLSRFSFRLTVPFLQVKAPEGTLIETPDGDIIVGEGPRTTESGIGDVVAGFTVYDVFLSASGDVAVDVSGNVKLGTADENKGLGTGETDFSLGLDFYRFFDRFTAIGALGYTWRGDPEGYDLDNTIYVSLGGSYRVATATRVGVFYDYRQASLPENDDPQELSVFLSRWFGDRWMLRGYALAGFGDSSPDFGVGVSASRGF
ncbi:MAG: hypothetical protein P8080_01990 [Gammaproteobacteria bacterium]